MSLDVALLRSSFDLVIERQPELTIRFYEILFARYPELEPLFDPNRRSRQARMLAEALGAVLEHLEDAAWLTEHLAGLGAKHVGYGVTRPMYDQVGECLLAAIAEAAGDAWSPDLESAWATAYGAIRDLMLAGAAEVEPAAAAG